MNVRDLMENQQLLELLSDKLSDKILSRIYDSKKTEQLLSNAEACEYLQVCSKTLKKYRESGTLEYSKVGRKFYYHEKDVLEFLKKNRPIPFIDRLRKDFRKRI